MKIESIKIEATIPCSQYANIRPTIEMSDVTIEEASEKGMELILPLFEKYSEKGGLIPKELITISGNKVKSFNEDVEIEFLPNPIHEYRYNGKLLNGVTDYIKKFYKPFDVDTISSVLESKWGVPAQNIRELWSENGEIASLVGTAVHRAIEYYQKHKSVGEIISSQQKEEENYALPKLPIIRKIVKEFFELIKDEKGEVLTEILLSDVKNGICGTADRLVILDKEKKICRVKDYKINIDSEKVDKSYKVLAPFDKLPSTKISKYQLQLSVYANLLQASGWVVEGLDVYIYENEWKHFPLEVLKVI